MNQTEMNEVAALLEDAFAKDYVQARLAKEDLPLSAARAIRSICIYLRSGYLELVEPEIQSSGKGLSQYPETKKVLLQHLVPSSCL